MAAPTAALGRIPARPPRAEAARFASVYERHHQALYRYCRSILRHDEDAQDALQSAMTRAFAALQTERRELEMRPWLFRIAHNEAVSILRRRTPTCALDEDLGDAAALEDRVFEREALRLLRDDLAGLTERQRWALVLRELNGLAHEEIATVLDTSPAAVKQAIFEARSALLRCREGRDTACRELGRVLSDGDGRVLRGRRVRAHLQTCAACRSFRDDLRRRPRELAALAPPLPAGAAAAVLRWIGGGGVVTGSTGGGALAGLSATGGGSAGVAASLAAKAAVAVVLAGGAVAFHDARHASPPPVPEPAAPAQRAVAATPAASRTAALRPDDARRSGAIAPRPATAKASAPAKATGRRAQAEHAATPPGQAKKTAPSAIPPGLGKKVVHAATPPGQARRADHTATPPGQADHAATPPGQAKKADHTATPPGPATAPPGQAKKATATPAAPGQARTTPGQAKKAAAATLPGQTKPPRAQPAKPVAVTPSGQAEHVVAAAPAGQVSTPRGQAETPVAATPQGQGAPATAASPPGRARKASPDPSAAAEQPGG